MYNFDETVPLQGINAIKTDALVERYGRNDLLPLWIADMDFRTPDFITDALKKRLERPFLGYTMAGNGLYSAITKWLQSRHHWNVAREQIDFVSGIVKGISYCVNAFSDPDDKIIIQPPVYHPFRIVCKGNSRTVVNNSLKMVDGRYRMDFELLEKQIDSKCKILILCNPHNPAGIMWDADTLRLLADICYERNILVVSDEIHADLILNKNQKHTPFATVSTRAEQNSITLMSGSKTFNIAGLFWSYSVIFNSDIHKKWRNYLEINGYNEGCLFASVALEAAYSNGQAWLTELLDYLRGNVAFITDYLQKNIPQIKPYIPQATYMMWLDCRQLGLPHGKVVDLFVNKARLALNSGLMFGAEGAGFMRLNFATSRKNLAVALEQLKTAVEG